VRSLVDAIAMTRVVVRRALEEGPWGWMTPLEREACMRQLVDEMEADAEFLVHLGSLDGGKPIAHFREIDVAGSVDNLHCFAG